MSSNSLQQAGHVRERDIAIILHRDISWAQSFLRVKVASIQADTVQSLSVFLAIASGACLSGGGGGVRINWYPGHCIHERSGGRGQVLADAVAGVPLLDVHIHCGAPHSAPHSLQGCPGLERRRGAALRHRSLRLPPLVRGTPPHNLLLPFTTGHSSSDFSALSGLL